MVVATFSYSIFDAEIDLTTRDGVKLYNSGSQALSTIFNGDTKDLLMFLNDLSSRSEQCKWESIVTFGTHNLLEDYGRITLQQVTDARDLRKNNVATTHAEARPEIDARMMFDCLKDSIGEKVKRKLSAYMKTINYDGPTLLKHILQDTFTMTQASVFMTKKRLSDLSLKTYKQDVHAMNLDVNDMLQTIAAFGDAHSKIDLMIQLFQGYMDSNNAEFRGHIEFLRSKYTVGDLPEPHILMTEAASKFDELTKMRSYTKQSQQADKKDDAILALTAKVEQFMKNNPSNPKKPAGSDSRKSTNTRGWRFDKSLSTTATHTHNGRTYHWCEGPGHGGTPMWCAHEAGTCVIKDGATPAPKTDPAKAAALTALTAALDTSNSFGDDASAEIQTLLAVLRE
jgi:hypothetical protein